MDVASTRLARFRAYEVTPARFTRISLGALTWIYLVVTTGAVVRLTGPGLGCHGVRCSLAHPRLLDQLLRVSKPRPWKGASAPS